MRDAEIKEVKKRFLLDPEILGRNSGNKELEVRILMIRQTGNDPSPGSSNSPVLERRLERAAKFRRIAMVTNQWAITKKSRRVNPQKIMKYDPELNTLIPGLESRVLDLYRP